MKLDRLDDWLVTQLGATASKFVQDILYAGIVIVMARVVLL